MENIKKFEDFSLVNEELESTEITMATPSATVKMGGKNYGKDGYVYMPEGRYTTGSSNTVKFQIENTGTNSLLLNKIDMRDGQLGLGAGKDAYFTRFTCKVTGQGINKPSVHNISQDNKDMIIVPGKTKCEFELDVRFPKKFAYKKGTPIFDLIMNANVVKGVTPQSKENGKILIEFKWNDEISYF